MLRDATGYSLFAHPLATKRTADEFPAWTAAQPDQGEGGPEAEPVS